MGCPVCDHNYLEEGTTDCPNCKADLTSFGLIKMVEKKRRNLKIYATVSTAIAVIVSGAWVGLNVVPGEVEVISEVKNEMLVSHLELLEKQLSERQIEITGLNGDLDDLRGQIDDQGILGGGTNTGFKSVGGQTIHVVQKGETLRSIIMGMEQSTQTFQGLIVSTTIISLEQVTQ
ncbi:MAG: hypothetical protein HRT71_12120 [Flavobacteriales bacterium]|nr:hypothetical protein [Flavobacteriales bacterium]